MTTTASYIADAKGTLFTRLANGEVEAVGRIPTGEMLTTTVVALLNRSAEAQDRREYTKAARFMAQADPFVVWDEAAK